MSGFFMIKRIIETMLKKQFISSACNYFVSIDSKMCLLSQVQNLVLLVVQKIKENHHLIKSAFKKLLIVVPPSI